MVAFQTPSPPGAPSPRLASELRWAAQPNVDTSANLGLFEGASVDSKYQTH